MFKWVSVWKESKIGEWSSDHEMQKGTGVAVRIARGSSNSAVSATRNETGRRMK